MIEYKFPHGIKNCYELLGYLREKDLLAKEEETVRFSDIEFDSQGEEFHREYSYNLKELKATAYDEMMAILPDQAAMWKIISGHMAAVHFDGNHAEIKALDKIVKLCRK